MDYEQQDIMMIEKPKKKKKGSFRQPRYIETPNSESSFEYFTRE